MILAASIIIVIVWVTAIYFVAKPNKVQLERERLRRQRSTRLFGHPGAHITEEGIEREAEAERGSE